MLIIAFLKLPVIYKSSSWKEKKCPPSLNFHRMLKFWIAFFSRNFTKSIFLSSQLTSTIPFNIKLNEKSNQILRIEHLRINYSVHLVTKEKTEFISRSRNQFILLNLRVDKRTNVNNCVIMRIPGPPVASLLIRLLSGRGNLINSSILTYVNEVSVLCINWIVSLIILCFRHWFSENTCVVPFNR